MVRTTLRRRLLQELFMGEDGLIEFNIVDLETDP
jgi:hypothetical protein